MVAPKTTRTTLAALSTIVAASLISSIAAVREVRSEPRSAPAAAAVADTEPCRGPEFAGCNQCCTPVEGGGCVMQRWSGGADPAIIPWYNATSFLDTDCPSTCRACASCSTRYEREYAALGERPDCNCETEVIGVDPCYFPSGCGCYCSRKSRILEACPHLAR